jgi:hypothetical protein
MIGDQVECETRTTTNGELQPTQRIKIHAPEVRSIFPVFQPLISFSGLVAIREANRKLYRRRPGQSAGGSSKRCINKAPLSLKLFASRESVL